MQRLSLFSKDLLCLGFAAPPGFHDRKYFSVHNGNSTFLNFIIAVNWLENFPRDFGNKFATTNDKLKKMGVVNVRNVKNKKLLIALLADRMKILQQVINHKVLINYYAAKCLTQFLSFLFVFLQYISLGNIDNHELMTPRDLQAPTLQARISTWPGLSGSPCVPLDSSSIQEREFIALSMTILFVMVN